MRESTGINSTALAASTLFSKHYRQPFVHNCTGERVATHQSDKDTCMVDVPTLEFDPELNGSIRKTTMQNRRPDEDEDDDEDDQSDDEDDDCVDPLLGKRTLRFPQDKLFGREHELEQLEEIFDRLVSPSSSSSAPTDSQHSTRRNLRIVLLEGYSGVGKSALIPEFLKRITTRTPKKSNVFFAAGKYNEPHIASSSVTTTRLWEKPDEEEVLEAFLPYSGIAQALTVLARQASTQSSSVMESTIFENNNYESPKKQQFLRADDCCLWPDDIRLLVDIAPGLAPFMLLPSSQKQQRRSHTSALQEQDLHEDEGSTPTSSTIEHQATLTGEANKEDGNAACADGVSLDDSNRTLITSNLRRSSFNTQSSGGLLSLPKNIASDVPHIAMVVGTFLRMLLKINNVSTGKDDDNDRSTHNVLVFFLDDLQWMDSSSLHLLKYLWKDPSMPPWMFIGTVRTSSEQSFKQEELNRALSTITSSSVTDELNGDEEVVHRIQVRNLSPKQVLRFVAETLDKLDPKSKNPSDDEQVYAEIEPLAHFIYSRTLGNIFYCRQVMEALARNHIIYYDVMWFEWAFNLVGISERNNLELLVEEKDVIHMVQDQLSCLQDPMLRKALIVASYISHSIDTKVLWHCLSAVIASKVVLYSPEETSPKLDDAKLSRLLEVGVEQGLLLTTVHVPLERDVATGSSKVEFKFSHDRVMESAYDLVPSGDARHKLRSCIGRVLLELAMESSSADEQVTKERTPTTLWCNGKRAICPPEKEWMLFVAVDHLNSLPRDRLPCDLMEFLQANYLVGSICLRKASFEQAVKHFRTAARYQQMDDSIDEWGEDATSLWSLDYDFCLALHNRLMETEFALGHYAEASGAISTILEHARCPRDMTDAHYTRIQMVVKENDNSHGVGAIESAKLLTELGLPIPENPTKAEILKERLRYQMALKGPISSIASLSMMEDDWRMKLLAQLCFISNMSSNTALHQFACLRALRLSLEQGISKYLLIIMTDFSVPMRRAGEFRTIFAYASVVEKLYERFPDEKGSEYATSRLILHSGMLHLRKPFVESMDAFLANYRMAMAAGNVDIAFMSAMHIPLIHFASGLPLNALLEPKLLLFQGKARQLAQPGYVAIFELCRQFVRLMQGRQASGSSSSDMLTQSLLFSEHEIVSGLNGNNRKMTLRDSAILRLVAAYIFNDEDTMLAMMHRLDDYPVFDLPLVRQHLRLTFHGLGALTLGRKLGDKHLLKQGQLMMKELRKLDSIGSLNASPAYLCLRAVDKQRQSAYDEAIAACSLSQLGHLEAIMNEQCGLMLLCETGKASRKGDYVEKVICRAHEYMENALWLYTEWGAESKGAQLRNRYDFLSPSRGDGSVTGQSSITTFFTEARHQRFNGVLDDPEDVSDRGVRGPPVMPSRNLGPPTMPRRSSSPPPLRNKEQPEETPESINFCFEVVASPASLPDTTKKSIWSKQSLTTCEMTPGSLQVAFHS